MGKKKLKNGALTSWPSVWLLPQLSGGVVP